MQNVENKDFIDSQLKCCRKFNVQVESLKGNKRILLEKKVVKGISAGRATMTEDGGSAKAYKSLTEVVVQNGRFKDAHYFVEPSNADAFIQTLG